MDESSTAVEQHSPVNPLAERLRSSSTSQGEQYIFSLGSSVQQAKLQALNLHGAYLELYQPVVEGSEKSPLVVKMLAINSAVIASAKERMHEQSDETELQAILNDRGYILFLDKKYPLSIEQLNEDERVFVYFAVEHRKHQEFYSPYILPQVFISYISPVDVPKPREPLNDKTKLNKYFLEEAKRRNLLTQDNRMASAKKGERAYAMIQDFAILGSSVFSLNPDTFTPDQKNQLRDFADKLQTAYDQYGFFPDDAMWKDRSGNLRFNDQGQLILIDTNQLVHKRYGGLGLNPKRVFEELKRISQ